MKEINRLKITTNSNESVKVGVCLKMKSLKYLKTMRILIELVETQQGEFTKLIDLCKNGNLRFKAKC